MRTEVLDYINTISLGGFLVTNELPWTSDGAPLYQKNLKTIYVDITERVDENLIVTFDGLDLNAQQNIVRIYFACDAKTLPSNYDDLVSDLLQAKNITTVDGVYQRSSEVSTSMTADNLVTELQVRFTKITT
jgi:hypothetical protein